MKKSIKIIVIVLGIITIVLLLFLFCRKHSNNNAVVFYRKGLILYSDGTYSTAIKEFTKAININPKYAEAYILRADCRVKLGDVISFERWDLAFDDYKKALSIAPNFPRLTKKISNFLISYGIDLNMKHGNFKKILDLYTKAIQYDPNNSEAYYWRGSVRYCFNYNLDAALQDLNIAIRLNSKKFEYYKLRGDIKKRLQNYNEAKKDYQKTVELDPSYYEAWCDIAYICGINGDEKGEEEAFSKALNTIERKENTEKYTTTDTRKDVIDCIRETKKEIKIFLANKKRK